MPLLSGKANIGHNITVEEAAGKPHNVALAIALSKAYDRPKSKKRRLKRPSNTIETD
jgi:hypothetical protein